MITELVDNLKKDEEYYISWKANIAMSFKDEVRRHKKETGKLYLNNEDYHIIANKAADNFLNLLIK